MKNFIFAVILLVPALMFADVEIKESFTNNMGFIGTKGTRTIYIKGNMERVDEVSEMTGKFAMMMSKGKTMETIQIINLGKKVIYNINPQKEVYSETDINDVEKGDSLYNTDSLKTHFEYDIKNMNESKTINGFKSKHYIATMRIIGEDKEDTLKITDDMWVSKCVPEWKTIKNYNRMVKTAFTKGRNGRNNGLKYMKDFYGKIAKIEGYPIKSDISMFSSGERDRDKSNTTGMQMNGLLGGDKSNKNQSKYGIRMFHSLTVVKSIKKKRLNKNIFKLKSQWEKIGN